MKPGRRILWSLYGTFIVYLILNFFIGDYGVIENQRLAGYRDALNTNIGRLRRIETDLSGHSAALRNDPDMVALFARELGYLRDDEMLVRIDGFSTAGESYTVGRTLTRKDKPAGRDPLLRSLAGVSGIFLFLGFSFIGARNHGKKIL